MNCDWICRESMSELIKYLHARLPSSANCLGLRIASQKVISIHLILDRQGQMYFCTFQILVPFLISNNFCQDTRQKQWCFEDVIKDIVQRTTLNYYCHQNHTNMEIWMPEAHKSMISMASKSNKYVELNTLKCKLHLIICIW